MSLRATLILYYVSLLLVVHANVLTFFLEQAGIKGVAFYWFQLPILVLVLAQLGLALIKGRMRLPLHGPPRTMLYIWIGFSVASALLLFRFDYGSPFYVALGIYSFLFYPLTICLSLLGASASGGDENVLDSFFNISGVVLCPMVLFGLAQWIMHSTLIDVTNSENVSKFVLAEMLGSFRPPSVFTSSFDFGMFCALWLNISAAYFLSKRRRAFAVLCSVVALCGISISQTRNVFFTTACSMLFLLFFWWKGRFGKLRGFVSRLPIAYVAGAIALLIYGARSFLATGLAGDPESLADSSTVWARFSALLFAYAEIIQPGSVLDFWIGYGLLQRGPATSLSDLYPAITSDLTIDNTYLSLLLFQGLIGMLLFLMLCLAIWRYLYATSCRRRHPFVIGLTSFVSVYWAAGIFNIMNTGWWAGLILFLSVSALVVSTPAEAAVGRGQAA